MSIITVSAEEDSKTHSTIRIDTAPSAASHAPKVSYPLGPFIL